MPTRSPDPADAASPLGLLLAVERALAGPCEVERAVAAVLAIVAARLGARCVVWRDAHERVVAWQPPAASVADVAPDAGADRWAQPITDGTRALGRLELIGARVDAAVQPWSDALTCLGLRLGRLVADAQAASAARERERRNADTIDLAPLGIAHVAADGRIVWANRRLCELLDRSAEELARMTVKQISHPEDATVTDAPRERLHAGEVPVVQVEKRYLRRDGTPVWTQVTIAVLRDGQGRPSCDIAMMQDIGARKQAEFEWQRGRRLFHNLVELAADWYWELDAGLRFTSVGGRRLGPRQREVLIGCSPWAIPGAVDDGGWDELRGRLERREALRDFEYAYIDGRGRRRHLWVCGEPQHEADGRFVGYRGVSRDITQRKETERQVQHQAAHDALTGLPNRARFGELLSYQLQAARRDGSRFAVLFVDLDHFKQINDRLGHAAGDQLLQAVAGRLRGCLRTSDVVARLGGDEFVMLVAGLQQEADAVAVAGKVLAALGEPVLLQGQACRVTPSIGIAVFPEHGDEEGTLLSHADAAMYRAKAGGRNAYRLHERAAPHSRPGGIV